jgi:DNA-directed RNA polymerase subunit RPC12/RpoP
MFQKTIYEVKKRCQYCNKDVIIRVRSEDPDFFEKAPSLKKEAVRDAMHLHWFHNHRVCARCGELIHKGEGSWALEDKVKYAVHPLYEAWTKKRYPVLDVHETCVEPGDQVSVQ